MPPTGQRAEVLFSRSAIAAADVTLFVCLHRLRFVSAGIFYPRSAQVELFSEPLRSVLKVSGSFALCQPHANMYMYTHYKAFDLCAFVLLSCSLQLHDTTVKCISALVCIRRKNYDPSGRCCDFRLRGMYFLLYCLYESRFFLICISGLMDRSFICLAQTSRQRNQPIT